MNIVKKILSDVNNPSHPSLGPNLFFLKLVCTWIPGRSRKKTAIYYVLHIYALLFVTSMIFKLIINVDIALLINLVQYSAFTQGIIKNVTLRRWYRRWERVVQSISEMEADNYDNIEFKEIILKYQHYSHLLSYVYWVYGIFVSALFFIVFFYINNNKNLFEAWLPFDDHTPLGRAISIALQAVFSSTMAMYVLGWDSLVVCSMVVIAGRLKALRVRCVHAIDSELEETNLQNIFKCHNSLVNIMRCQSEINSLITFVFFVHLVSASVNYGICISLIMKNKDNMMEIVNNIQLLSGVMFQLLLYYWPANQVIEQNDLLSSGIFESSWVSSSVRVRRAVLLLSVGMRQRVAFSAGPFNEMSIRTFIQILKASYSYYTLLSTRNN